MRWLSATGVQGVHSLPLCRAGWGWVPARCWAESPAEPWADGAAGQRDPGVVCAPWAELPVVLYTSFCSTGGCAQLLFSESLMCEQRSKQDTNATPAPFDSGFYRGKALL